MSHQALKIKNIVGFYRYLLLRPLRVRGGRMTLEDLVYGHWSTEAPARLSLQRVEPDVCSRSYPCTGQRSWPPPQHPRSALHYIACNRVWCSRVEASGRGFILLSLRCSKCGFLYGTMGILYIRGNLLSRINGAWFVPLQSRCPRLTRWVTTQALLAHQRLQLKQMLEVDASRDDEFFLGV